MDLAFLLTERQKYADCKGPLILGDGKKYFLQPPEVTNNCLDEIVNEIAWIAYTLNSGSRIDNEGTFYSMVNHRGNSKKDPIRGIPSLKQIFEQMSAWGYTIPENYWTRNRQKLMPKLNRRVS